VSAPGSLLHNLLLFGRVLRGLGLDVSPGRMRDLAAALAFVEIGRRADVQHAARSLLVHRREDIPLFDAAFEAFWRKPRDGSTGPEVHALGEPRRVRKARFAAETRAEASAARNQPNSRGDETAPRALLSYSPQDVLRQKDFALLTGAELEEVRRLILGLCWSLGQRMTRRRRPGAGAGLDLRRTLRRSLRHGGEVLDWARHERTRKPRPLVILADVSGSMERYTRLLLLFAYGLAEGLEQSVEAFVFGTRLTRVTRQLRGRDADRALGEVARRVPDWSGGTRIGEALRVFNFRWARRVLGRGAVVLLISDGWDRGEPELLRAEAARLQQSCHRLIWLNPLKGSPDYEPLTRGMQAALPYTDDFLPAHSLGSLEALGRRLQTLGPARRSRPQRPRSSEQARSA
jgi:uncharacterized protein with von Willebrand factor type A (vWA) domain